jgi:hypothetical protein
VFAIRDHGQSSTPLIVLMVLISIKGFKALHYQHLIDLRTRYFLDARPILSEDEKEPQIQNERSSSESTGLDARGSPQNYIEKFCLESLHLVQQTLH